MSFDNPPVTVLTAPPADTTSYTRLCVGVVIKTQDSKILLQQRDAEAPRFPNNLGTFGGGMDDGEMPLGALVRELNEELGAVVDVAALVPLAVLAERGAADRHELIYGYFWHDTAGTITGCYEGNACYYDRAAGALSHPQIMNDARWFVEECVRRGLVDA
jgi:8-oxo-dGTP diphosphatase